MLGRRRHHGPPRASFPWIKGVERKADWDPFVRYSRLISYQTPVGPRDITSSISSVTQPSYQR